MLSISENDLGSHLPGTVFLHPVHHCGRHESNFGDMVLHLPEIWLATYRSHSHKVVAGESPNQQHQRLYGDGRFERSVEEFVDVRVPSF